MRKTALIALALSVPLATALAQPQLHRGGGAAASASASGSSARSKGYVPATGPLGATKDALAKGDYADAERLLRAITGAARADALAELARIQVLQGKLTDAEATCGQLAAAGHPGEAAAVKANILFHSGKREDAIKLLQANQNVAGMGGREVRVELGELLIAMGRRADADTPLQTLAADYRSDDIKDEDSVGMTLVGRATELLHAWKNADFAYGKAETNDERNIRARIWHALEYHEKFDDAKAMRRVRDVLKLEPKNPDALVLMARLELSTGLEFDTAEGLLKDALAINPKHVGAHAVRAGLALHDMDIKTAEAEIAAGFAVDPNDLELWSLKATARFLADDRQGYDDARKEALSRNKEYARFFTTVGEYAEWEHRYGDIVTMMQEAVKVDPDDGRAWAELGLFETRQGDEQNGVDALRKAFAKDNYNLYVYNTLDLYESNFAKDYDLVDEGPFKVRYSKRTEPILRRYLPQMLGEAWASMKARYHFVPAQPIQIEVFEPGQNGKLRDARQQFNVRISGLGDGMLQGVCFGHVIAGVGPLAEPFNWGMVFWHELGHVFAIQLSKNHVPRWFTEGLSEYETIARRPEWRREMDPDLYVALKTNQIPGSVDMNRAFTHARDTHEVVTAYYAASQLMVFTVERFGMDKVVKALELWGQNQTTADVIQNAFGLPASEYDRAFRAWEMKRLARYDGQFLPPRVRMTKTLAQAQEAAQKSPSDADVLVDLAIAYAREQDADNFEATLAKALAQDPKNVRAHYLAYTFSEKADPEKELAALQTLGGDGYFVRSQLATQIAKKIAKAKKAKADTTALMTEYKKQLEAAYRFDPTQAEVLGNLFELAHEDKREGDEVDILRKVTLLEENDPATWAALLKHLVADGQWEEARRVGESAIFVAIYDFHVHTNYARALAALGDHTRAVYELETALLCEPAAEDAATIHALAAQSLVALKRTADAKQHADEAKRLDPNNAELSKVHL